MISGAGKRLEAPLLRSIDSLSVDRYKHNVTEL